MIGNDDLRRPSVPREAFAVSENFTEISLDDDHADADMDVSERHDYRKNITRDSSASPLFLKMSSQAGFLSLPQSGGRRSASYCGSSWEANKDLDETTFGSHVLRREILLSHHRPTSRQQQQHLLQRSIKLEELEVILIASLMLVKAPLKSSCSMSSVPRHSNPGSISCK